MSNYGDLEPIARAYCKQTGVDPDARVAIPCPDGRAGCCVAHYGPAWKSYLPEIETGIAMIEAISEVVGSAGTQDGHDNG